MLKNLSIKSRLIFVLFVLSAQLVVGAAIGLVSLNHANESMQNIYANRLVAISHIDKAFRLAYRLTFVMAKGMNAFPEHKEAYLKEIEDSYQRRVKAWASYKESKISGVEQQKAEAFEQAFETLNEKGLKPALEAFKAGESQKLADLVHVQITENFEPFRVAGNDLIETELAEAKNEQEAARSRYDIVWNLCILGIVVGLTLSIGIGTWLIRSIVVPVKKAVTILDGMAQGDLTAEIEVQSGDEVGMLMARLKNVNDNLSGIVNQVRAGSDAIHSASTEIAAGNHELSARTEQQATSLEETASSMEELTATVRQNADNAEQGNVLSASASAVAKKGGEVVGGVVRTMKDISESSSKIAEITAVIDGIAFQTNILALNAAVEAARAGEQGRGFAVVATEVRSLAHRSGEAAKQIKALIEESAAKVTEGTQQVALAGATMSDIVQSVTRVSDIMTEISVASREQSAGIEQVGRAIVQMDQVTQQNAALVEEAAAAASAMQDEAAKLTEQVGVFRTPQCLANDRGIGPGNRLPNNQNASRKALA